jgi:hypothetical protein
VALYVVAWDKIAIICHVHGDSPHHFLDHCDYGYSIRNQSHEYGHAFHLVTEEVLGNLDREIVLVIAADEICHPGRYFEGTDGVTSR